MTEGPNYKEAAIKRLQVPCLRYKGHASPKRATPWRAAEGTVFQRLQRPIGKYYLIRGFQESVDAIRE
jgi:hypothetical protein